MLSRVTPRTRMLLRSMSTGSRGELGLVGLGKMGRAMAKNFIDAGYSLVVYDVSEEAVAYATSLGARAAKSPRDVAAQVPRVVSIVPNDAVVDRIVHDKDTGLLASLAPGGLHVSCSTISPQTARRVARDHAAAGQRYVAAPIFARPDGVEKKTGTFVVAGEAGAVAEAKAVLTHTVSNIYDFGTDHGAANVVKLCGNFLIAAAIESIGESLSLAEKNGVDRAQVMDMLSSTIFDCLIYKGYGQRIAHRDHRPGGFSLELGYKDVSLVGEAARAVEAPMPIASLLRDRFMSSMARGRADLDWSAAALAISEEAGVDVQKAVEFARKDGGR